MTFEMSAPLRPGDAADFLVLLPAVDGVSAQAVHGSLRVLRILDAHPGAPSLFSAEVLSVRADDRSDLDAWLARWATDSGRRFEALSTASEQEPEVEVSETSDGWTDALESSKLPHASLGSTSVGAPSSPVSAEGPVEPRLAGREAIRAALRRGLSGRSGRTDSAGAGSASRVSAWLVPSRERARRQVGAWLPKGAGSAPAMPPSEPDVLVDSTVAPPRVEVVWRSAESYAEALRTHLRSRALFVATTTPLAIDQRLAVVLTLPDGRKIQTSGRVVAPMATGMGLALDLDDATLQALSSAG